MCTLSPGSRVRHCVTPWTAALQAPLCMRFSRQESWSGLPFRPLGHLPRVSYVSRIARRILDHGSHLESTLNVNSGHLEKLDCRVFRSLTSWLFKHDLLNFKVLCIHRHMCALTQVCALRRPRGHTQRPLSPYTGRVSWDWTLIPGFNAQRFPQVTVTSCTCCPPLVDDVCGSDRKTTGPLVVFCSGVQSGVAFMF